MEFEYLRKSVEEHFETPFRVYKFPYEKGDLTSVLSEGTGIPILKNSIAGFLEELNNIPSVQGVCMLLESSSKRGVNRLTFGNMNWHVILDEYAAPDSSRTLDLNECIEKNINSMAKISEFILEPSLQLTEHTWTIPEDKDFNDVIATIVRESITKRDMSEREVSEGLSPTDLVVAVFPRPATEEYFFEYFDDQDLENLI